MCINSEQLLDSIRLGAEVEVLTLGHGTEIDTGREFVERIGPDDTVVLLFGSDVDGISAAAILYRTLAMRGDFLAFPEFMDKGETIYSEQLAKRILARQPSKLIVMDTGSRGRPILPNIPTMVIDDHKPERVPPVDAFVSSYGAEPPAPTSLLTYEICKDFVHVDGREWLAALGTIADLGIDADFEIARNVKALYGIETLKEVICLIDSAHRAPEYDLATPFEVLVNADNPKDIIDGALAQTLLLRRYNEGINSELRKLSQLAPQVVGRWALLAFRSPALLQPLLASTWASRLADNILLAANYAYVEGKVCFSLRTVLRIDLIEEIHEIGLFEPKMDYGHRYAHAIDAILPAQEFDAFVHSIGFSSVSIETNLY
ncbi:MAG: hypothetical protein K6U00_08820, partial [Armatimonadetes bacterium]|nr:hypothetical protein [Armatimonadota bacterium]